MKATNMKTKEEEIENRTNNQKEVKAPKKATLPRRKKTKEKKKREVHTMKNAQMKMPS